MPVSTVHYLLIEHLRLFKQIRPGVEVYNPQKSSLLSGENSGNRHLTTWLEGRECYNQVMRILMFSRSDSGTAVWVPLLGCQWRLQLSESLSSRPKGQVTGVTRSHARAIRRIRQMEKSSPSEIGSLFSVSMMGCCRVLEAVR